MELIIEGTIRYDWKDKVLLAYNFLDINKKMKDEEESGKIILPKNNLIFNAFNYFNVSDTKVIIIGQDPYLHEHQAMGLSFSVPNGVRVPPSLQNIFKEINRSLGLKKIYNKDGDLTRWAEQGVLLLNRALTLRSGKSNSHKKVWKKFTDYIIRYISKNMSNCVFLLWGNNAIEVEKLISDKHLILKSGHPSPLNRKRDFINNNHFLLCNKYLKKHHKTIINW